MTPEENEDDIATMLPRLNYSMVAQSAIERQKGGLGTVGSYIAATVDARLQTNRLTFQLEATVSVIDSKTGEKVGEGRVTMPISYPCKP